MISCFETVTQHTSGQPLCDMSMEALEMMVKHVKHYVFTLLMSCVQVSICGMCGILSVLCAGFSVRSVQSLVCVLCGLKSVLCAVFSICYVQSAVTSHVASLRACLASLGREARDEDPPKVHHLSN